MNKRRRIATAIVVAGVATALVVLCTPERK